MRKTFKRQLILLAALILPSSAHPAGTITINPGGLRQKITVMGGDMERSSMFLTEAADPGQVADWAFRDISFNICRVQYDKHQEIAEGKPDFNWYRDQIAAMKLVRKANPNIAFFATLRSDYHGYKMGDGNNFPSWVWTPESKTFNAAKWGGFLADYVIHFHRAGVPIRCISTGKEITQTIDARLAIETIRAMFAKLDAAGVPRPEIADPGAWSLPQAVEFIQQVESAGAQKLFHAYATHNYRNHGESEWAGFVHAARHAGAEAWNAESGLGSADIGKNDPPISASVHNMARRIQQYRAGINGEMFFEIWSRGIPRESRAIYFNKGEAAERMRGYYLMQSWTNSVFGNTVVETACGTPPVIDALAFRKDDDLCLWIVNTDSAETFEIDIAFWNSKAASPVDLTSWSKATPAAGTRTPWKSNDKGGLTIWVPPHSITKAAAKLPR